ncbi:MULTISPECIES: hypothetical protein [Flavobacterium]|nr:MULTISPECIES: hypothetical protein [Flavobacterium]
MDLVDSYHTFMELKPRKLTNRNSLTVYLMY